MVVDLKEKNVNMYIILKKVTPFKIIPLYNLAFKVTNYGFGVCEEYKENASDNEQILNLPEELLVGVPFEWNSAIVENSFIHHQKDFFDTSDTFDISLYIEPPKLLFSKITFF